ncbi:MAG TPA: hypothetical protein VGN34_03275 [Ktedonobacteraceae bacterium]
MDGRGNIYLNSINFQLLAGEQLKSGIIALATSDSSARHPGDRHNEMRTCNPTTGSHSSSSAWPVACVEKNCVISVCGISMIGAMANWWYM